MTTMAAFPPASALGTPLEVQAEHAMRRWVRAALLQKYYRGMRAASVGATNAHYRARVREVELVLGRSVNRFQALANALVDQGRGEVASSLIWRGRERLIEAGV